MYDWNPHPDAPFRESLAAQKKQTIQRFETRLQQTILAFAEQVRKERNRNRKRKERKGKKRKARKERQGKEK